MTPAIDILLTDLRHLLAELGRDGGLISPSIYDTAQVVRLAPPSAGVWPALEWLLSQQRPDGGWGDPASPRARDLPTLAAVLALQARVTRRAEREAMQAGLAFLHRQAGHWVGPLPEDLPIGAELLLPSLLRAAEAAGLKLPTAHYKPLIALGQRRHEIIRRTRPRAATSAVHSWEAWGADPDPDMLDRSGGVGHSPAAAAAWLAAARCTPAREEQRAGVQRYLDGAARATGTGIPGVLPTAWPINRFEHLFGPYALMMAGLLDHPAVADIARAQVANIAAHIRPRGFSFSDDFEPDGDDTAAGLAMLKLCGHPIDLTTLRHYERDNHFCTYPYELQISLSVTARAVYTLTLAGADASAHAARLAAHQYADGGWYGDKWNRSWLYTTSHVVQSLHAVGGHRDELARAFDAILAHQHPDGGWGSNGRASRTETAYAILTLRTLRADPALAPRAQASLARARRFMRDSYRPFQRSDDFCWIGKVIYRPYRVDHSFELSAMVALELDDA